MTTQTQDLLKDGDRVSHKVRGLGTVHTNIAPLDIVVPEHEDRKSGADLVYVVWDDDRFPVGRISRAELEDVPDASAAISTGF